MIRTLFPVLGLLWANGAAAIELSMPTSSRLVSERGSPLDSYDLPIAPWNGVTVPFDTLEGRIDRQSWRIDSGAITTLQLLEPLRAQLRDLGFDIVLECETDMCGGFDFRFAVEVIPTPDMYVDIRDFRFLSARKDSTAISLLVSRSRAAGYVQIINVDPSQGVGLEVKPSGAPAPVVDPPKPEDLASVLLELGHVTLDDLEFETGSANLSSADYESLQDLAAFMEENTSALVVLVGHTDATGDLEVNIAVSKRRAEAVRNRLIETLGADGSRLQAEGMGYLAPRATNLTSDGRERNRRVEAILLSLE